MKLLIPPYELRFHTGLMKTPTLRSSIFLSFKHIKPFPSHFSYRWIHILWWHLVIPGLVYTADKNLAYWEYVIVVVFCVRNGNSDETLDSAIRTSVSYRTHEDTNPPFFYFSEIPFEFSFLYQRFNVYDDDLELFGFPVWATCADKQFIFSEYAINLFFLIWLCFIGYFMMKKLNQILFRGWSITN